MNRSCFAPVLLLTALTACGAADTLSTDPPFDAAAYLDTGTTPDSGPDASGSGGMAGYGGDPGPVDASKPPEAGPPHDAQPDTGIPTTKACKNAGGVLCTDARWLLCPAGYEPVGEGDGHFNCGQTNDGWCCQEAPPSSCSASGSANCIPGSCTGCFDNAPDQSLACEQGRACCVDICD